MIAAVFPGQGAQKVGMGKEFFESFPQYNQIFQEANDTLGYDLKDLVLNGPSDKLQLTEYTQPALLATSFATYSVAKEKISSLEIKAAAGHSVGEYAALVAAGVIRFSDALKLVRLRGQLMQESVPVGEGGMAAVMGLDASEVEKLCAWACEENGSSPLEPANFNSPAQTVISGRADLVQFVAKNFSPDKIGSDKKKVRIIPLKVSAPFHCSMMGKAESGMAEAMNEVEFKRPEFGIVQNYSAQLETDPATIKKNIISQISGAVRWVECMQVLKEQKASLLGEFGPGNVLTGLIKKIDPDYFTSVPVNNPEDIQSFESKVADLKNSTTSNHGELS